MLLPFFSGFFFCFESIFLCFCDFFQIYSLAILFLLIRRGEGRSYERRPEGGNHSLTAYFFLFLLLAARGGVTGRPPDKLLYWNLRLSAGFKIWNEHISVSSTDIIAPITKTNHFLSVMASKKQKHQNSHLKLDKLEIRVLERIELEFGEVESKKLLKIIST